MTDDEIVAELTKIKGIGRWTVEMLLIFRLTRPDVFPAGDLGIVKAIQRAYNLRRTPDVKRLQKIAEPWDQLLTFYRTTSNARVKYKLIADAMPGDAQHLKTNPIRRPVSAGGSSDR